MKKSVMRALLRIARAVLQSVLATIMKQMNIVEGISKEISGRYIPLLDSWQGEDADAFRAEIQQVVLPLIMALVGSILGIQTGINDALTRVDETDKKCTSYVDDLANQFRAII